MSEARDTRPGGKTSAPATRLTVPRPTRGPSVRAPKEPLRPLRVVPAKPGVAPRTTASAPAPHQYRGEVSALGHIAERARGVMLNRVEFKYGMNDPAANTRATDETHLLIAQGNAYSGKSVSIRTSYGVKTYPNAAVVFLKKQSGATGRDHFFVKGFNGEKVRIYSVRFQDQTPATATNLATDLVAGEAAWPEADPYRRNVALPIVSSPADGSAARGERFIYDQRDPSDRVPASGRGNFLHE